MASDDTPIDPADPGDGPTRRADSDDSQTRRADPDDFATVRGLPPGRRVFGRYALDAEVGRGGMGVVWKARDVELERVVALKFLPDAVARDAEAVGDLKRETRACLELTHPNIVRVHHFERDDSAAAIVMEFVDGPTLQALRGARPQRCFSPEEIADWVRQLCNALEYAHNEAHVVHRDLKPLNLMVDRAGRLKVTDFGIAGSLSETKTRLTGRSAFTPSYASPQQVRGHLPTVADDVYALGATLYDLLTGKPPFFRGDLAYQTLHEQPAPIAVRRAELGVQGLPAVSRAWEETIRACLAKEPENRPKSAGEVARRLGLTTDVRERLRRDHRENDRTGGTADHADGADEKETKAGQVIDDGAARRVGRQPGPLAGLGGRERERVDLSKPDVGERISESDGVMRTDERGRSVRRWLLLVAAAMILGIAGYFLWPRPDNRRGAASPVRQAQGLQPAPAFEEGRSKTAPLQPISESSREFTVTVDPTDVGAKLWLGPLSDVEIKDGKAVLKDIPDGEQELTVQAPGYQPFTTRVTVKDGRGNVEAKLVPVRGEVSVTARPGTQVSAVDERGRETRVGSVPAGGVLDIANLLTVGRYTLKLEHADCAPVTVPGVELVIGRTIKVAPAQTPLLGELRVFSVPTGAEVRVNGTAAGSTPATIKNQPSEQALRVEVYQRGYRRTEQSVTLKPKEARTVNVGSLVAESGGIDLRFTNDDLRLGQAAISVDGKAVNVGPALAAGPLRLDNLEVGSRTVEIAHPDYEPWRQEVTVCDQEVTTIDVKLAPKPGRLTWTVTGPNQAMFTVDGRELTAADFKDGATALPAQQEMKLEVKAPGYKTATRTLKLPANGADTWQVAMEKQPYPEAGQAWENTLGMKFVSVPGTGVLFCIWDTRVQDFEAFVKATGYDATAGMYSLRSGNWGQNGDSWRSPGFSQGPTHPVCGVNWDDAKAFCRWLTEKERREGRLAPNQEYRLPTDAEWSVAVGLNEQAGGTPQSKDDKIQGVYPWGTQWPPPRGAGNFADETAKRKYPNWGVISGYDDGFADTSPVGSFAGNRFGLYDMGGNVWQWCEDFYNGSNGSRVLRGGSFYNLVSVSLLSARFNRDPDRRNVYYGFRCVVVVSAPKAETLCAMSGGHGLPDPSQEVTSLTGASAPR